MAGHFLSLDGPDGGGKTTQLAQLADWLRGRGREVITCRDPGGTPIGDRIRALLLDRQSAMTMMCEALLYVASRAELVAQVIRPALERGALVLADRFGLANVVYQGHAGGLDPGQVWELSRMATDGLLPEHTWVLDVPPAAAAARRRRPADRLESRGLAFEERVRAGFLAEAARNPTTMTVVDATPPAAAVQAVLREEVARVLGGDPRP
jgi:dTMP kinase